MKWRRSLLQLELPSFGFVLLAVFRHHKYISVSIANSTCAITAGSMVLSGDLFRTQGTSHGLADLFDLLETDELQ